MQRQEVPEKPASEEHPPPLWVPPPMPPMSARERLRTLLERFGFLMAMAVTLLVLTLLFLNADWLLREPAYVSSEAPAAAEAAPAVPPPTPATATLSVETQPAAAAVFVNGDSVGLSPLRSYALPGGTYRLSVRKPAYAALDTTVTLGAGPVTLRLALQPTPLADDQADDQALPPAETASAATPPPDEAPAAAIPRVQENRPPPSAASPTPPPEVADEPETAPPAVGDLQITSQPSGASVFLGQEQLGVTPLRVSDVPAGPQQVTLRLDGYEVFTASVTVQPQQDNTFNGQLRQRLGTLKILAIPWGSIYIDGELRKRETNIWYTAQLPPGVYRVRVEHPALGKWENRVSVVADKEEEVVVDFNAQGRQQN